MELSTLLAAVKPRERTDQYRILAALYCLEAHKNPVTAKAVSDLLKLHFGLKKAPRNVNASLRSYTTHVAPAERGPPIRWKLLDSGSELLRTQSGLSLADSSSADFNYDVGVICALEQPEFEAVQRAFGGAPAWSLVGTARFPNVYRETSITTADGKTLRIVGTTSNAMGLTPAAIVTTHLILQFKPRLVIMVGIAAGTRGGNRQFGDILVADPSVDYNSGKVDRVGEIREFRPDPYPIGLHSRVRGVLRKYAGSNSIFTDIRSRWRGASPKERNGLHIGPVGAADQVIDDETRIIEIQRNWRKLIGVEMETYAVYRACHEAPEPKPRFASFKSVCDFAAEKSDSWQQYAAFVAAEFTLEFLKAEWTALWPNL